MSEEADGRSVATTRQKAGSALNGGMPRPPLYPRPSPAVLPVTLPGTSGTAPIVPAKADDPPPPRPAGFAGTVNAPAFTTCVNVIAVFGSVTDPIFPPPAARGRPPRPAAPAGKRTAVRINMERMGLP